MLVWFVAAYESVSQYPFFISVISGLISGLISGVVVSWWFYYWSGKKLREETESLRSQSEKLRKLSELMMRAMKKEDGTEITMGQEGDPEKLRRKLHAQNEVPFDNGADQMADGDSGAETSR